MVLIHLLELFATFRASPHNNTSLAKVYIQSTFLIRWFNIRSLYQFNCLFLSETILFIIGKKLFIYA